MESAERGWRTRAAAVVRGLHWAKGMRAGVAVASAMLVCRALGRPMGWAALGGFEAVLVDNGGPYRSRMQTIATVLLGGAACGLVGSLLPPAVSPWAGFAAALVVTAAVCFGVTFARVASQPIASTSVIILVLYFAGFGSSERTVGGALGNVAAYGLGGVWAGVLSLVLWPVDPFRPARLEVAGCYELLAGFAARVRRHTESAGHDDDDVEGVEFKRTVRAKLESARAALAATPARAPARTVRARNLSVLLETADMLFVVTVRLAELAESAAEDQRAAGVEGFSEWLTGVERAIAAALRERPADAGESFGAEGSHRLEHVARRAEQIAARGDEHDVVLRLVAAEEREALADAEIAFEAVRAVWSGVDSGAGRAARDWQAAQTADRGLTGGPSWTEALRDNWTMESAMMRHALRMAAVGAADVLLMRVVRVPHGFWLAMTSIIVLQPYSSGTLRKSVQRVGGTVAGGFLAAGLAAVIHSYAGIIVMITLCSVLTLATYAVDYGWYSFFLTPTFVLMSLPHLRDWRYAGVRMLTTLLGAATAVGAMRLLWPESLRAELGGLLARSADAAARYAGAVLTFWEAPGGGRAAAERAVLAPARRACGLTSQEAEEALDRAISEPLGGRLHERESGSVVNESALTFTTYVRRFTQCLTTLAAAGEPDPGTVRRMGALRGRLERVRERLLARGEGDEQPAGGVSVAEREEPAAAPGLAEAMLERMERQTGVLERAAAGVAGRPFIAS